MTADLWTVIAGVVFVFGVIPLMALCVVKVKRN